MILSVQFAFLDFESETKLLQLHVSIYSIWFVWKDDWIIFDKKNNSCPNCKKVFDKDSFQYESENRRESSASSVGKLILGIQIIRWSVKKIVQTTKIRFFIIKYNNKVSPTCLKKHHKNKCHSFARDWGLDKKKRFYLTSLRNMKTRFLNDFFFGKKRLLKIDTVKFAKVILFSRVDTRQTHRFVSKRFWNKSPFSNQYSAFENGQKVHAQSSLIRSCELYSQVLSMKRRSKHSNQGREQKSRKQLKFA